MSGRLHLQYIQGLSLPLLSHNPMNLQSNVTECKIAGECSLWRQKRTSRRQALRKKHQLMKDRIISRLRGKRDPQPTDHKTKPISKIEHLREGLSNFFRRKLSMYQESGASSCEFSCPICLEMYMSPRTTSCGHMFCFSCIDESVIRSSSCPSCRSNIRNEQFRQNKNFSSLCSYFWSNSDSKDAYLAKAHKNQEWFKARTVDVSKLAINDELDVRDTESIWCKAKILKLYQRGDTLDVLVHFVGWNEIYNQIISASSQRLAPYKFFTERTDIPKYKLSEQEGNMISRIDYPENNNIFEFSHGLINLVNTRQLASRNIRARSIQPLFADFNFPRLSFLDAHTINIRLGDEQLQAHLRLQDQEESEQHSSNSSHGSPLEVRVGWESTSELSQSPSREQASPDDELISEPSSPHAYYYGLEQQLARGQSQEPPPFMATVAEYMDRSEPSPSSEQESNKEPQARHKAVQREERSTRQAREGGQRPELSDIEDSENESSLPSYRRHN